MRASTIINKATSYIGTVESPANSNNVIFNTDYYGGPVSGSAYPWCMAFVWDIFRMCGASDLFYDGQKTAYCPTLMNWAKQKGKFVSGSYQAGDVLFFDFYGENEPCHTGFAITDNGNTVTTVEGNTASDNSGDQSNGGGVFKRTRNKSVIIGAYRPSYEAEIKAEWKKDSKGWKYLQSDGTYCKSVWKEIDSKWYYFEKSGYMAANKYIKSATYNKNRLFYYVSDKGDWNNRSYKWEISGTKRRLKGQESKHYVKSKFVNVDGITYYLNATGYAVLDKYIKGPDFNKNKLFYYMDKKGVWNKRTYKWEGTGAKRKLKGQETKHYVRSKFANVDGKWYYFNSTGSLTVGTKVINKKTYIFNTDGTLKSPANP